MEQIYKEFRTYFDSDNKEGAVNYILGLLHKKEIDIVDLYENILQPSLNHIECKYEDAEICIWEEHIKTGIIRTIIECCYPFVMEKKKEFAGTSKGKAIVLCPPEEYHDVGARMVTDFLTIIGYEAIFVGSNTPHDHFLNAVEHINPKLVAISVTNYYNLVITKKLVQEMKEKTDKKFLVLAGGNAFDSDPKKVKKIGADFYVKNFTDIYKITQ